METIIEASEVRKSFGSVRAVDRLSFSVSAGEIYGIIGPDGAGKTTLLRMIVTLLRPDGGHLTVRGYDVSQHMRQIRALVGYMPQRFSLYPDLSVKQNLHFFAELFNVPKEQIASRKRRLYEFSRLEEFSNRLAGRLSGGMKQKLALSCTLIHDPVLLVLDEPTTGVDPVSRTEFWNILQELRAQGVSIVVSTPYMDEALLCDHVIIMHNGCRLGDGAPAELLARHPFPVFSLPVGGHGITVSSLETVADVVSVQIFGETLHVTAAPNTTSAVLRSRVAELTGQDIPVHRIDPTLEDVFISLVLEKQNAIA
ncbi:MAG: ABC transporter ATP-binding protein [Bacteroidia bacterium]|nr:ABC transporter ATP-binding protein [Bacteroidia bacterium]